MEPSKEYSLASTSSWSISSSESPSSSQVIGKRKTPELPDDQSEVLEKSNEKIFKKVREFFNQYKNTQRRSSAQASSEFVNARFVENPTVNPRHLHFLNVRANAYPQSENNELIEMIKSGRESFRIPELLPRNITKQDQDGRNAFHHAALRGDAEICRILLEHVSLFTVRSIFSCFVRRALNTKDALGYTPLGYAFKHSPQLAFNFITVGAKIANEDGSVNIDLREFKDILDLYDFYCQRQHCEEQHIASMMTHIFENILTQSVPSPAHLCAAKIWMNFKGTPEESLKNLFQRVVVVCVDREVYIPQLYIEVLKEQSDYFKGLLNGGFKEFASPNKLPLSSMDAQNFEIILRMIFSIEDQEKDLGNIFELIKNIKFLGIKHLNEKITYLLTYKCQQIFTEDGLDRSEAFVQIAQILDFANTFELNRVREAALLYIQKKYNCSDINLYFSKSHENFDQFRKVIEVMCQVPIESLDLFRGYLTDATIIELSKINSILQLTFTGCVFLLSDDVIQKLLNGELLPNLRALSFLNSSGDLEGLKKLQRGRKFNLQTKETGSIFYPEMYEYFSKNFENFKKSVEKSKQDPIPQLDFSNGRLTNKKLSEISKIVSLENLTFKNCRVNLSEKMIEKLGNGTLLPNLKNLYFIDCRLKPSMKVKFEEASQVSVKFA